MDRVEILKIFQDALAKPLNHHLEQYISDGGKCIGHYCSLIPGEILTAAGIMPYRIRGGSDNTSLADVYLGSKCCTFVKHTVNLALEGEFDFLNGIISMNSCDMIRRSYTVLEQKKKFPFSFFMSVPKSFEGTLVVDWYRGELERLVQAIEEHFSVKIGQEDLLGAIKLHNQTRQNLIKLNELRKTQNPSISGQEALTISIAAQVMPLNVFNKLLEQFLEGLDIRTPNQYKSRFIVSGGELDEPDFIKIIEDQGGLVIYDDTCFGSRYYQNLISEEGDPLENIAARYLYKVPCARFLNSFSPRYENLMDVAKNYQADGIIFQRLTFCVANGGHMQMLTHVAKTDETAVPVLFLDREYLASGSGQIKTRVQAFIESVEANKRRKWS